MTIDTADYEAKHGHKPVPGQKRMWYFAATRQDGETAKFPAWGTFRQACLRAKAKARTIGGVVGLRLCP